MDFAVVVRFGVPLPAFFGVALGFAEVAFDVEPFAFEEVAFEEVALEEVGFDFVDEAFAFVGLDFRVVALAAFFFAVGEAARVESAGVFDDDRFVLARREPDDFVEARAFGALPLTRSCCPGNTMSFRRPFRRLRFATVVRLRRAMRLSDSPRLTTWKRPALPRDALP